MTHCEVCNRNDLPAENFPGSTMQRCSDRDDCLDYCERNPGTHYLARHPGFSAEERTLAATRRPR